MKQLDRRDFDSWLHRYGAAWETRDPAAAARLFTADAEYYWTPFDTPQRGQTEIAGAWEGAVSKQADVRFTYEMLAVAGSTGIAHWHASFKALPDGKPIELDGMLTADFDEGNCCRTFREWWHLASGAAGG